MTPQTNSGTVYAQTAFIGVTEMKQTTKPRDGGTAAWHGTPNRRKQPPWHVNKVPPQRFCWLLRETWANFINAFSSLSDRSSRQPLFVCGFLAEICLHSTALSWPLCHFYRVLFIQFCGKMIQATVCDDVIVCLSNRPNSLEGNTKCVIRRSCIVVFLRTYFGRQLYWWHAIQMANSRLISIPAYF